MPWMYCEKCEMPLDNWEQGVIGCPCCGWKYYAVDDPDVSEVISHLMEEIDDLKAELNNIKDKLGDNDFL